ncbi:MAG: class I SAM-dependent methyltransferase [Thermoplasmatota archaeon]
METARVGGSFRDPAGFVFRRDGTVYRQVNETFARRYDALHTSGVYESLVSKRLLIPHEEVDVSLAPTFADDGAPKAYRILKPEQLPAISYPYEWAFSQLQDAALLTLRIQKVALSHGMTLRDASARNVQFVGARPIFIDTLSFEPYQEGEPWIPYRQFCEQFLAPLALASYRGPEFLRMPELTTDGIPLTFAATLLPWRARMRPGLFVHLRLHSKAREPKRAPPSSSAREDAAPSSTVAPKSTSPSPRPGRLTRRALDGLLGSLTRTVTKLRFKGDGTWSDYAPEESYGASGLAAKEQAVERHLSKIGDVHTIVDLGANTGAFSMRASPHAKLVVATDGDPYAVELAYQRVRGEGPENVLPLVLDLANPSPARGWAGEELDPFHVRFQADAVMALALVHHLAIGRNVPLPRIAEYFAQLGQFLLIEFVPKTDPQVMRMLAFREDVFPGYTREGFEAAFAPHFRTIDASPIQGTQRVLYLMERSRPR